MNRYFEPGENRAARVDDLFATVAPRYDLINDLQSFGLHRLWKRRLVELARPRAGERALDLCCGTGDVSFLLARSGAQATGLDFSAPMLEIARQRRERLGTAVIDPGARSGASVPILLRGDAQDLPFPNESFDIVTVSYGLRNLTSWQRGLEEMHRVTIPGGRLLVLDFGKPDNALWRSLYFTYLATLVPLFGRIFCGDSQTHSYIIESLRHYPAQHGVAEAMRRLGCHEVRIVNLLGGVMTINHGRKPIL